LESAAALRSTLSGDLNAIVLMALRTEPERRYGSAEALSADVLRYLKGLPVQARADTVGYRVRSFLRRQRALVSGISIALIALTIGLVVSVRSAREARREAERARRVATLLQEVIGASGSNRYQSVPTLLTVLDSARIATATQFAADARARADLYAVFAGSYFNLGRSDLALQLSDSARVLYSQVDGPAAVSVALALVGSANPLMALGQTDSSMARLRAGLSMLRSVRPRRERQINGAEIELSFKEIALLQSDSAIVRMHAALDRERADPGVRLDEVAYGEAVTVLPHYFRKQLAEAEPLLRELLSATETRLGAQHYLTAQAQNLLAKTLLELGRWQDGRVLIDSAIASNLAASSRDPMYFGEMYITRAAFEIGLRDRNAAERTLALAGGQRALLGVQQPILEVSMLYTRGALHEARGQIAAARQSYQAAVTLARTKLPPNAKNLALAEQKLSAFDARHRGA